MNKTFEEVVEIFDQLYDKGYRFLDSFEKNVIAVECVGVSEIRTPVKYKKLVVDGVEISNELKERAFNFLAFRMAIKLKDGQPLVFKH